MYYNFGIDYNFLNCTKEIIDCLNNAKQIASIVNSTFVKSIHLGLSLIFNSELLQRMLKIYPLQLNKKIFILNILFNYKINLKKKNYLDKKLDKNVLNLFNILNSSIRPFDTLVLFYYILKQDIIFYYNILIILNIKIKDINSFLIQLKNYVDNNFLIKINIPSTLQDYLTILKKENNLIINREEELNNIINILLGKLNKNIILLGSNGVGKTAIINKLISLISNKIFIELDIMKLMTQIDNNIIILLLEFLNKYNNIILYCKNIHLLFDNNNLLNLKYIKNIIYELLYLNKIQIIGTSTENFYNKILKNEKHLKFLFSKINIFELDKNILFLIMKYYIQKKKIN